MITGDYVSFETAKLLKEKGFDEECCPWYGSDGNIHKTGCEMRNSDCALDSMMAPTLQMAMKWLREVHNIDIAIYAENAFLGKRYSTSIWKDITKRDEKDGAIIVAGAITYEEAAETSIKYCLENLL